MIEIRTLLIATFAVASLASSSVWAQDDDLQGQAATCSAIHKSAARLKCFDKLFPATKPAPVANAKKDGPVTPMGIGQFHLAVEQTAPRQLSPEEIAEIQKDLATQLKDPGSAKFGDVFATTLAKDSSTTVCGFVNAKNSYGGYSGMEPFVGGLVGGKFVLTQLAYDDSSSVSTIVTCQQFGMLDNFTSP